MQETAEHHVQPVGSGRLSNQKSADKPDSTTARKVKISLSRGSVRSLPAPPKALEMI